MRRNTNLWIQLFMAVSKKSVVITTSCTYGNKSSKVRSFRPKPPVVPPSFGPKTRIQGVDPGMVTMASGICSDQKMLFTSINRYEALQGSQETVRHGKNEDMPFKMTTKIVNAAVNTKTLAINSPKKKQKKRVQSKCRLRRFHGKHCSQHRRQMGSDSFITFAGNWHGSSSYIKGHTRRSAKP
ncbi:hypothetical protein MBANPS3_011759 [Mucor bainieri]